MPIGDPRDGFFYPTLTLMMDTSKLLHVYVPTNMSHMAYIVYNMLLENHVYIIPLIRRGQLAIHSLVMLGRRQNKSTEGKKK